MTGYTAHIDRFAGENLPPREQWPEFRFDLPELQYPERLNAAAELLDRWVEQGEGDRRCLVGPGLQWSYAETQERVNRIANVLVGDLGLQPGNRLLLRAPNSPMMVAVYLAALKVGAVVVATMPMLRPRELAFMIDKARVSHAVCDARLADDLDKARATSDSLQHVVCFGTSDSDGLEARMNAASGDFAAVDTAAEDVCLIGFTSGTTGRPKGTMHFHRDLLATCDTYGRHVLQPRGDDLFIGSPPIAFTFGLGGLVLFPMRVGAGIVLVEQAPPPRLIEAIKTFRPTVCFTAPTAYRAMASMLDGHDVSSLRICVSAGEPLPRPTWDTWHDSTGIRILDGIGSTEMLHIFIGAPADKVRPGATGLPVPGYEARVIDDEGREVAPGTVGRLAVRGPTGCRYLADERQLTYVQDGWNITGDTYAQDEDGYFWFQARADDMIISSGYNIAGPEVEEALLSHPAVAECGVVGAPDEERGQVVTAYVVLKEGHHGDAAMSKALADHVKAEIAPYKYPRTIFFVDTLPRTQTNKLQRFVLRQWVQAPSQARAG
ncbi:MAG: benzoate-CoA ligase family protein [Hyphomicrobiales bacterium]